MGNQQSVPSQPTRCSRPTNRLSKPRTNTHSGIPNGRSSVQGSRVNSFNTATHRLSTLNSESWATNTEITFAGAEEKPPVPPKPKRRSIFRSRSSRKQEEADEETEVQFRDFETQGPSEQMLDRWSIQQSSRTNSFATSEFNYEPPVRIETSRPGVRGRTHRWSAQPNPPFQQHNPQLSLVDELPNFGGGEHMISRYQSKRASTGLRSITSSVAAPEEEEYMISRYDSKRSSGSGLRSRTNSETAIRGPIRRRSLQQHGVATRTGYLEQNARQSMPPTRMPSFENFHQHETELNPYQQPYQTPQKAPEPVSQLQEFPDTVYAVLRPSPNFHLDAPRTETPTELDYGHIGAFKLGTLRITNGAASPVASEWTPRPSIDAEKDEEGDYLTMGPKASPQSRKTSGGATCRNRSGSATLEVPRKLSYPRSPLRNEDVEIRVLRVDTHLPLPALAFEPFDFQLDLTDSFMSEFKDDRQIKTSSVEIKHQDSVHDLKTSSMEIKPRDSIQDLASVFSFTNSPPITPQIPHLEITSKPTAVEDSLFEAEPETPSTPMDPSIPRSDSGYGPGAVDALPRPVRTIKGPREQINKPLAKADSGYSSNVSLRSFKKESKKPLPSVPAKDSRMDELTRVASGTYSFTSSTSSENRLRLQRSLPALPHPSPTLEPSCQPPKVPSKESLRRVACAPPVSMRNSSAQSQKDKRSSHVEPERKGPIPKAVFDNSSRETSPALSERSSTGSASTEPSSAPSSTSSRWRLRSMLKPESKPQLSAPYTVQAFRSVSEQLRVPKPSVEAKKGLEKREKEFPVNNFRNTMPTYNPPPSLATQLRRTASKETLGTIFSVGSMEVREEMGFARLQKSLPAVPNEETILEDPTGHIAHFPRSPLRERKDMVQISQTVKVTEGRLLMGPAPFLTGPRAQVQVKKRDWGRRSLLANFNEPNPPESPPKTAASPLGRRSLEPMTLGSLVTPDRAHKVEVKDAAKSLQMEMFPDLLPWPVRETRQDIEQLPPQSAASPMTPESASSKSNKPQASLLSQSTPAAPSTVPEQQPKSRARSTPSPGQISTHVSVTTLRRLYQPPGPVPSFPAPIHPPLIEEEAIIPPPRQEPQRQEWRRRSSNASAHERDSSPPAEVDMGFRSKSMTTQTQTQTIQGPTDAHLITSIATYPANEAFRNRGVMQNESLSRSTVSLPTSAPAIVEEHLLMSNQSATSSRRSLRAYPPQAHVKHRNMFSQPHAPEQSNAPPVVGYAHNSTQMQNPTYYSQIDAMQELDSPSPAASSPRSPSFGANPPISMSNKHSNASLAKRTPPSPSLSQTKTQSYFALRNSNAEPSSSPAEDESWQQTPSFWARRRASAGQFPQRRGSIVGEGVRRPSLSEYGDVAKKSIEGGRPSLDSLTRLDLSRSNSDESQKNAGSVLARGRPVAKGNGQVMMGRWTSGVYQKPQVEAKTRSSMDLRGSRASQSDLRSEANIERAESPSIRLSRPEPVRQESTERPTRPELTHQTSTASTSTALEKRSKSVGFAPQPWEPARHNAVEQERFLRKRQSMDRMARPTLQPARQSLDQRRPEMVASRRLSIDTLPSQTGLPLVLRKANPSPILGQQGFVQQPHVLSAASHHRSVGDFTRRERQPPAQPTLIPGSHRSFDQSQSHLSEQQRLAWNTQQPTRSPEMFGTNSQFAQNFPTIPKSIGTYHGGSPVYPQLPGSDFFPSPALPSPSRSSTPSQFPSRPNSSRPTSTFQPAPATSPRLFTGPGAGDEMMILDRYSGGLEYNFSSGLGNHGSTVMIVGGETRGVGQRKMWG